MFENLEQLMKTIRERKKSSPDKSYTNKIHEAADVMYHLMVYLEANNIKIEDVMSELKKRQK